MKINIGAGIQFRSGLARDVYAAGGVRPEFVGDFTGGVYRVDSAASTFTDAFTFARTGTATFVDADGILQTAADGVARTGHHIWNGSEWAGPFLQLESEARTNLTLDGNDFDPATTDWITSTLTEVQNATGIDGTTSAWTFTATATNTIKNTVANLTTITADADYTVSKYLKKGTERYGSIYFTNAAGSVYVSAHFDYDTGLVTQTNVAGTASLVDANVEPQGNGFYRVSLAGNLGGGITQCYYGVAIAPSGTPSVGTFGLGTVNATGTETFIGTQCQFEAGSTPSSLIPTTGTAVTRNAETRPIDAADVPYSATAMSGSVNAVLTYADDGSATQQTIFDRRVDVNNRITVTLDTSGANTGRMVLTVVNGGTTTTVQTTNQITPGINVPANVAWRVATGQINIALNGTAATAVTNTAGVPDVSAADATIAIMGSEEIERHWADDIGDAGIAAASA